MNKVFDWCVKLLEYWAPQVGMTYKELNVWLFVIIMPAMLIGLAVLSFRLWLKLKRRTMNEKN